MAASGRAGDGIEGADGEGRGRKRRTSEWRARTRTRYVLGTPAHSPLHTQVLPVSSLPGLFQILAAATPEHQERLVSRPAPRLSPCFLPFPVAPWRRTTWPSPQCP